MEDSMNAHVEELECSLAESSNPDLFFNLGNSLDEEGRYEEAASAYRRCIECEPDPTAPNVFDAWLNLGHALRSGSSLSEAENAWEQALRCDPGKHSSSAILLCRGEGKLDYDTIEQVKRLFKDIGAFDPKLLNKCLGDRHKGCTGPSLHRYRLENIPVSDGGTPAQDMFVRLFCIGYGVRLGDVEMAFGKDCAKTLIGCCFIKVIPGPENICIGSFQVFTCFDMVLLTDWPSQTLGPEGDTPVMSIGTDSLELCACVGSPGEGGSIVEGARVLDLCTGSGIAALYAKRFGALKIVAVDVSARACAVAKANAFLNGLEVDVLQGNLYGALGSEHTRFDVILANPPFVAAPVGPRRKPTLFADGGPDGTLLTAEILLEAERYLSDVAGVCVVVGEFPNIIPGRADGKDIGTYQPDWTRKVRSSTMSLTVVHGDCHVQSAEEYAADRADTSLSRADWIASLQSNGVLNMTSGVLVAQYGFDGGQYRRVSWEALDADESWIAESQRFAAFQVMKRELSVAVGNSKRSQRCKN